jgi:hypothetical protein
MFYAGNKTDVFRTAVIDTLVSEVDGTPGEDRAILLLVSHKTKSVVSFY